MLSLIDRGTGRARSMVIDSLKAKDIVREAAIMTDEAGHYSKLDRSFASHDFVSHSKGE